MVDGNLPEGLLDWDGWLALELGAPQWLIPGILERGGGGLIHGGPRSFKSFLVLRLCLDLASGQPVLDLWPLDQKYRTLLFQAEGSKRAWRGRMVALRELYPASLAFWSRHTLSLKLDTKAGREVMVRALEATRADMVVIDPIAHFFSGSDSDADGVQRWIDTVNGWREQFGCAVILVHHDRQPIRFAGPAGIKTLNAGMDEARGSSRLPAWADFVGAMSRKDDATALTVQKVRDEEDGQRFTFVLKNGTLRLSVIGTAQEDLIVQTMGLREWWMADLARAVAEKINTSDRSVRRTIEDMVARGLLGQERYGARLRIFKVKEL